MDQELSWLRSEMSEEAGKIFEAINIKQLPNVIKYKDISNYMPSNLQGGTLRATCVDNQLIISKWCQTQEHLR